MEINISQNTLIFKKPISDNFQMSKINYLQDTKHFRLFKDELKKSKTVFEKCENYSFQIKDNILYDGRRRVMQSNNCKQPFFC